MTVFIFLCSFFFLLHSQVEVRLNLLLLWTKFLHVSLFSSYSDVFQFHILVFNVLIKNVLLMRLCKVKRLIIFLFKAIFLFLNYSCLMLFLFWLVLVVTTTVLLLTVFLHSWLCKNFKISNLLTKIKLCKNTITNSYTIALLNLNYF